LAFRPHAPAQPAPSQAAAPKTRTVPQPDPCTLHIQSAVQGDHTIFLSVTGAANTVRASWAGGSQSWPTEAVCSGGQCTLTTPGGMPPTTVQFDACPPLAFR
jgi:hypothetical protein